MDKEVSEFFDPDEVGAYGNTPIQTKEVNQMPRRNENAFQNPQHRKLSRWDRGYQPIGAEMSLEMSRSNPPQGGSGVPNKNIKPPKHDVVNEGYKPMSCIKTTAESIVRDFRRNEGFNTYEAAGAMRPLCRKVRRPFFLKRWFRAVDWNVASTWACWAALIACLIYLGIFVFAPFTIKLLK
jgi:hypothetical protein